MMPAMSSKMVIMADPRVALKNIGAAGKASDMTLRRTVTRPPRRVIVQ